MEQVYSRTPILRYNRAMRTRTTMFLLLLAFLAAASNPRTTRAQDATAVQSHVVAPGDSWDALALRYGLEAAALQNAYGHVNRQWQPPIGATLTLPQAPERMGTLTRPSDTLLSHALSQNTSPWQLALQNGMRSPFRPALYRPILQAGGSEPPRDLPPGFTAVTLTPLPPQAGRALLLQAQWQGGDPPVVELGQLGWDVVTSGDRLLALGSTGAFFETAAPELAISTAGGPGWSQPWLFVPGEWDYQQVTFSGTADFDREAIVRERERLDGIWTQVSPEPKWQRPWIEPISGYLEVSSDYGARRSVNGGPYATYHEGVDFAAYRGTAVVAPAAGTVVLAEFLDVRGGSVIVDHGLGVFSGYYHLSAVDAVPGQIVQQGDKLGEVGTTGRSTGNHLHWDLLVNGRWVDAAAWLQQDMGCKILDAWARPCLRE